MTIHYLTGDATQPVKNPALIMHVCNNVGGWGRGFVLSLSKRWRQPEVEYRSMRERWLGDVQFVGVEDGIVVANMIGQHGMYPILTTTGSHVAVTTAPIRYEALSMCLEKVNGYVTGASGAGVAVSIHAPRIGCGLAGGSWAVVEPLIAHYLSNHEVYIYDLPEAA